MSLAPVPNHRRRPAHSRLTHGLVGLAIHGTISLVVATYAFVLALHHDLGSGVVEGLFGTLIGGHVVGAAAAQLHGRQGDHPPGEE
jgi:hypothetical protein